MPRHLFLIVLCFVLALISSAPISAQTPPSEPTLTPQPPQSLFPGDPCAPPCWYGLTPGISTRADILHTLEANNYLEARTENLCYSFVFDDFLAQQENNNATTFGWGCWDRNFIGSTENYIEHEAGIITLMRIEMNMQVSLRETLEKLGQPTFVNAYTLVYEVGLELFYPDWGTWVRLYADKPTCTMATMREDFQVMEVFYYSPEGWDDLVAAHYFDRILEVPQATWQAWLNGEVSGLCDDVIGQLYDAARATPTLTVTPEITVSP